MGTPEFALPGLAALAAGGHQICGVVTVPDKPAGRGQQLRASAVKIAAQKLGLPLMQPEDLRDPQFIAALAALAADLFVVVAFRILPREVFSLPRIGTINLHASLLPHYRGAAPINWAIINGESETGATTFFIDDKVDTGEWLLQCKILIGPETTAGELHDRLAGAGAELLLQTLAGLEAGTLQPKPQQGTISKAPKLTREMALIDWNRPTREIHNLVRGLSPYPAAWTLWQGKVMKVLKTQLWPAGASLPPGSVIDNGPKGELIVAAGEGALALLSIQPEGGKVMAVSEFLRGHTMHSGEKLGSYEFHP